MLQNSKKNSLNNSQPNVQEELQKKDDINMEPCYNCSCEEDIDKRINDLSKLRLTLTVREISKVLGVSLGHAYTLCSRKDFPCVRIGKRMIIPRKAFEKWMENPFEFSEV